MKTALIDEIKSKVSCINYMEAEHQAKIVGGRCKSFRADATNPSSLLVNERDWYDFGSGIGGDVIDLAANDKFAGNIGRAIGYLADKWNIATDNDKPEHVEIIFNSYRAILDLATTFYEAALWKPEHENVVRYLNGRGLTDDTIKQLRLGWADNPCPYIMEHGFTMEQINETGIRSFVNRIMVPYLRNGKAVYLIGRASVWPELLSGNPDAKYMKLYRGDASEHPIWGLETLRTRPGTVIVAEGIFDAISCWQEGYPVVTAVTGAFSSEQKKDLIPALKDRRVIVCMDYDPETHAGQKFTTALSQELFDAGISVSACYLTGDDAKKDISQLYAAYPNRSTLEKTFAQSVKWERMEVQRICAIKDEDERKGKFIAFMKKAVRSLSWLDVAELLEATGEHFSKAWLRELQKILKQPPTELEIAETFAKQNEIIFHPSLGFFRYEKNKWNQITEYDVRCAIEEITAKYTTAKFVSSILQLVKDMVSMSVEFENKKDMLNFPNGMVNVETGEKYEHSKDYYSMRQMGYLYDPKEECKNWLAFLESVTNGDAVKQALIQEMFGYCLTRDVRYQKCFCLIGEGSNGKSVLLKVLEAMVGHENTSHIEIAFLNSDFQRIKLLGSLVNICNDMKSDVSGTESYLKAIVSGDPINGCKKHRDFVDFTPYCKMVFSSNHMPTARDIDFALIRRFTFIVFPVKFVDNPKKEDERMKVDNMEEILLKELPGIFNWALQGLKRLREQARFSEPADEQRSKEELYRLNNPVVAFVEEVIGNGGSRWTAKLSRTDVYHEYNEWCKRTNTRPLSARGFWPRLREVFPMRETRGFDGWYVEFTEPRKYCGDSSVSSPSSTSDECGENCGDPPF